MIILLRITFGNRLRFNQMQLEVVTWPRLLLEIEQFLLEQVLALKQIVCARVCEHAWIWEWTNV